MTLMNRKMTSLFQNGAAYTGMGSVLHSSKFKHIQYLCLDSKSIETPNCADHVLIMGREEC